MIIHSPIISGSLTFANGATFTLPDNGIYSGSFSGSVKAASVNSHLIPSENNTFDLGSETKFWRDLYISTGSIKFVGSSGAIVGTLSNSGNGMSLDGGVITRGDSSFGTSSLAVTSVTGSLRVDGRIIATSISGAIAATNGIVSGSSQITYASVSSIPAGIVSGSTQVTPLLPTGVISGSSQVTYTSVSSIPAGIVSGSAQIDGSLLGSNKTITIGSTSTTLGGTSTTIAGLTSVTSTTFVGALTGNASTVTTNANLTGNVTSVGNATTIASGVVTSDMIVDGTIVNGDINASAAIVDTKLATISTGGKVSNSATTATNANTVSAIVARDGSGNFSAGTITAALTGNASTATTAAALTTARTINGTSFDGSANITIPNLVSGSAQVSLTGTTGYGTYIDQALLTTSNVTHNNVTVSGNLTVSGTTTTVNSTTLQIGDNIIELNGNGSANGGLLVKDPTAPTTTSGSLLWDSTNDYWKAGAAGSELPLVTTSGTQTLTNKTISGGSNTLSNIGNGSLTNSTITIGSTSTSLGGTSTTLAGLTSVTSTTFVGALTGTASNVTTNANLTGDVTSVGNATTIGAAKVTNAMLAGSISNANLANSAITIGSTSTALGATSTTIAGLTSVTSTTFVGALTGNASTATTAGTVTTAAQSAITSVGTLTSLTVSGATATGALTVTGAITATGDITAFAASDIRFKENITAIESPIKKIKMISGNTYDWKAENKDIHGFEGNDVGVIAQEIEEVLPQLVVTRDNGYKAVKYDKLVALLIEGIKEQQKQIEDLSNKINKLENEL